MLAPANAILFRVESRMIATCDVVRSRVTDTGGDPAHCLATFGVFPLFRRHCLESEARRSVVEWILVIGEKFSSVHNGYCLGRWYGKASRNGKCSIDPRASV
jgi:hypothetical protein